MNRKPLCTPAVVRRAAAREKTLERRLNRMAELQRLIRNTDLSGIEQLREHLAWLWNIRPCGVCGSHAGCRHREPEVDAARLTGMVLALEGRAA